MRKALQVKEVGKAGDVAAVVATLNVKDKDGDVTEAGFFGVQYPSIVGSHNWQDIMLGKGKLEEQGDEAIFDGMLNLEDPDGKKLHTKLKFDMENPPPQIEWSYNLRLKEGAQIPFKDHPIHGDGQWLRGVDGGPGVKVNEVSPVLIGAGEDTRTLGVKAHKPGDTVSILEELAGMGDEEAKAMLELHKDLDEKNEAQRFIDQLNRAVASVEKVTTRADEILELRPLGAESREELAHISLGLKELAERVAVLTVVTDDAALAEFLRFQKLTTEMRST